MISPNTIITPRYLLRSWNISDAKIVKETLEETKDFLIPWMPWMPWAHGNKESIEEIYQRLRIYRGEFDLGRNFRYGIFEPTTKKLIGECGLYFRVGEGAIEIGYWVHKDFLKQGIATEVTQSLIKVAFEFLAVKSIEIHCNADNLASTNVPRKLGFHLHKTFDKAVEYSPEPVPSMIWTLSKASYKQKSLNSIQIQAFNSLGEQIL